MIWKRKLGVFELLLGMVLFELLIGDRVRAIVAAVCAVVAWYTKKKFQGEFSLADAWSVVSHAGERAAKKLDGTD